MHVPPTRLVCYFLQALDAMKSAKLKRVYYDFQDWLKTQGVGSTPYTPALSLMYGLKESIALLKEEGLDNVVARHHRLAEGTRKAVEGWGLELLCSDPR